MSGEIGEKVFGESAASQAFRAAPRLQITHKLRSTARPGFEAMSMLQDVPARANAADSPRKAMSWVRMS